MSLILGLEYENEYDPRVKDELEQLIASLQQFSTARGAVIRLDTTQLLLSGDSGMTWTPNSSQNLSHVCYAELGNKLVWFSFSLVNTSVGGTVSGSLQFTLPNGWYVKNDRMFIVPLLYNDNGGGTTTGTIQTNAVGTSAPPATNTLKFARIGGTNWTASTAATSVYGQIIVELL